MENLENLKLPSWIIKSIPHGEEEDDIGSILVNVAVFYLLGVIAFFVYTPNEYLIIKIICTIGILFILILFGIWLIKQITLLRDLREEVIRLYKHPKTDEKKRELDLIIKKLWIPIPKD